MSRQGSLPRRPRWRSGTAAALLCLLQGCAGTGTSSLYFAGLDKHFAPTPSTNEGNMNFVGYTRDYRHDNWNFETGVSTYVDSYHRQSYMVFSNVTHEDYHTAHLAPLVTLSCQYKGDSYTRDSMKLICAPPLGLRIGADHGLFGVFTPVPKLGKLTNGFVSIVFGYKFRP